MPGLITITQRVDGETLTAAHYNADRQEIVTGMDPSGTGGWSANVAQMQATTDPGDVGSEVLPAALSGELQALRFILQEMKGGAQWYVSDGTKTIIPQIVATTNIATGSVFWPHGSTSYVSFLFPYPPDVTSGNLTLNLVRHWGGTTGNQATMSTQAYRFRDATAQNNFDTGTALNFTAADQNSHLATYTMLNSTFVVGDWIRVDVIRSGSLGSDTNTGNVILDAATVTYTGLLSRVN